VCGNEKKNQAEEKPKVRCLSPRTGRIRVDRLRIHKKEGEYLVWNRKSAERKTYVKTVRGRKGWD